jgi:hypothetical protein
MLAGAEGSRKPGVEFHHGNIIEGEASTAFDKARIHAGRIHYGASRNWQDKRGTYSRPPKGRGSALDLEFWIPVSCASQG